MSKNDGALVAGGCVALVAYLAFYVGFVALLVWIICKIVASVF